MTHLRHRRSQPTTSLDKLISTMDVSRTCSRHACTILLGGGLSKVQEGREAPDCGAAPAYLAHAPPEAERPVPEQNERVWVVLSQDITPSRKSGTASSVLRPPSALNRNTASKSTRPAPRAAAIAGAGRKRE